MNEPALWQQPYLWVGLWLVITVVWGALGRRILARPVLGLVVHGVRSWALLLVPVLVSLAGFAALFGLALLLMDRWFWWAEAALALELGILTLLAPLVFSCLPAKGGTGTRAMRAELRLLGAGEVQARRLARVLALWALGMMMAMVCALLGVVLPVLEVLG